MTGPEPVAAAELVVDVVGTPAPQGDLVGDRCFDDVDPDAADPIQCRLPYGHAGPHKELS